MLHTFYANWCAGAKASEGYPPMAKSAEAAIPPFRISTGTAYAFIHGQSPCLHAEVPACRQAGVTARRRGLLRRRINTQEESKETLHLC